MNSAVVHFVGGPVNDQLKVIEDGETQVIEFQYMDGYQWSDYFGRPDEVPVKKAIYERQPFRDSHGRLVFILSEV